MKAQNAYLEAIENNDVVKLREIYSKYSIGRRPPSEACEYLFSFLVSFHIDYFYNFRM